MKDHIIEKMITADYIPEDWGYFAKKAFKHFYETIAPKLREIKVDTYPEKAVDIFRAFKLTPLDKTKVVIIGQD